MQDPLRYFRIEAREIVEQLQAALLALERGQEQAATVVRLLRLAHTLKGAARVVKQSEIASLSHQLEDLLVPHRESALAVGRDVVDPLLAIVDELADRVSSLAAPAAEPSPAPGAEVPAPAGATPERGGSSPAAPAVARLGPGDDLARVAAAPLEHVELLMDGVAELGFQLAGVGQALPALAECRNVAEQLLDRLAPQRVAEWSEQGAAVARALGNQLETSLAKLEREVGSHVDRASRELGQVRDRVDQLRLVATSSMFGVLERATRDCAVSLGKSVRFEATGGELRLDAEVLTAVQRALLQAVRNAVAHGIESSDERAARRKPAQGQVRVEVQSRGKQVCFVCADDGKGVDLPAVRREAERLGRLPPSGEPSSEVLLGLLLNGGISTSAQVSEVAGRGVGLDLIREALLGVGGSVSLHTSSGLGTNLELIVPASLSALDALLVEAAGEVNAIPLRSVVRALRLSSSELNRTAEATSIAFEGQVVPFFPLALLLRQPAPEEQERRAWTAVVIRAEAGLLALGLDRLLGAESIVSRGLPESVRLDPTIAGVSLDAAGNPRLLLDPDGLLAAAAHTSLRVAHGASRKRTVLVIDDSLTTRMLEQSILESAGYEVALATSAEEGLEMAQARSYDLFLVDVEMPGMDGFDFVERTRADPQLSRVPAVLVTSRVSPEDLARGREVGASGHIAKAEFDQVEFLERIDRLTR